VHTRTEAEIDEVLGPQRAAVFKPHYRVKVQALRILNSAVFARYHSSLSSHSLARVMHCGGDLCVHVCLLLAGAKC
jgi:hypothetical protein